ncbi:MAG TPA: pentapeptide repeat-containing protein, partial [Anaerolineae bacterium]|nr:pentapeptide repeat-containing protein [Anaerolineae bacterium]
LVKADLREVDLSQADLSETMLRGAKYNDMTRWPAGFDPTSAGVTHEE